MITFKQFVLEKRMSSREYQRVFGRVGEDALVGFEIEVLVPPDAPLHTFKATHEYDSMELRHIDSMELITKYFAVSTYDKRQMEKEYGSWLADKEDAYIDDNYQNYLNDDDDNEDEARDEARSNFDAPDEDVWIEQEIGGFNKLPAYFGLDPKYGFTPDGVSFYTEETIDDADGYTTGLNDTIQNVAAALEDHLGVQIRLHASSTKDWVVTTDTSIKEAPDRGIDDDMKSYGLEIISPPQKINKAFAQLEEVLSFVKDEGFKTNFSTGIHINLSLPDLSNLDVVKLVLFMGDAYVLDKFDRSTNVFTSSQLRRVIDGVESTGSLPTGVDDIKAAAEAALKVTEKYSSVNLKHLPTYLEFRAAGGDDYHLRLDDIKELVGRWVSAIELATDPAASRKEYVKKLYKLLDKTSAAAKKSSLEEIGLLQFIGKRYQMIVDVFDEAKRSNDQTQKVRAFRTLMIAFYEMHVRNAATKNEQTPFKWLKEARQLFNSLNISAIEVLNATPENTQHNVKESLRVLKLLK